MSYVSNFNRRESKASRLDIPFNQSFQEQRFTGRIFHFAKVHLGFEGWFHSIDLDRGAQNSLDSLTSFFGRWVGLIYVHHISPKKKWTKRPSWMMINRCGGCKPKQFRKKKKVGCCFATPKNFTPIFCCPKKGRDQKIKMMRDLPVLASHFWGAALIGR